MLGISRMSSGLSEREADHALRACFSCSIDRYVDLLSEEFNKVTPENSINGPAIPIVHNTCSYSSLLPLRGSS